MKAKFQGWQLGRAVLTAVSLALALAACAGESSLGGFTAAPDGGSDAVFDPGLPPAGRTDDESTPDDGAGAADPGIALKGIVLKKTGFKKGECGQEIAGTVQASGGTGDFTWDVEDLPSWTSAAPTGARDGTLAVSGTLPYEECDETEHKATATACDAAGACKDLRITLKTKIPKVKIKTRFQNLTLALGQPVNLQLEATGGSGDYEWTTEVTGELNDPNDDATQAAANEHLTFSGSEVLISTLPVGMHTVTVAVKDRMVDDGVRQARERETPNRLVARDVKTFTVKVGMSGEGAGHAAQGRASGAVETDPCAFDFVAANKDKTVGLSPRDGTFRADMKVEGGSGPFTLEVKEAIESSDDPFSIVGEEIAGVSGANGSTVFAIEGDLGRKPTLAEITSASPKTWKYRLGVRGTCEDEKVTTLTIAIRRQNAPADKLGSMRFQMYLDHVDEAPTDSDCDGDDGGSDCSFMYVYFKDERGQRIGKIRYDLHPCSVVIAGEEQHASCEEAKSVTWNHGYDQRNFREVRSIEIWAHAGGINELQVDVTSITLSTLSMIAEYDDEKYQPPLFPGNHWDLCDSNNCWIKLTTEWMEREGASSLDDLWVME